MKFKEQVRSVLRVKFGKFRDDIIFIDGFMTSQII